MRTGMLDRRISIEYKEVNQDSVYGTEVITWQPLVSLPGSPRVAADLWASMIDVPPGRTEITRNGAQVSIDATKCTIRYRSDVTSAMRVVLRGVTDIYYQIVGGPAILGRNQYLELLLEKITL